MKIEVLGMEEILVNSQEAWSAGCDLGQEGLGSAFSPPGHWEPGSLSTAVQKIISFH